MAELKITVCDQCGERDRSVRKFTVITDRRSVVVDLCDEHGGPLESIVGLVPESTPPLEDLTDLIQRAARRGRGTARDGSPAPVDELAARKRNHKPKP